ncbi:hypothetical protein Tco_0789118 [Tanacetum coccineum]
MATTVTLKSLEMGTDDDVEPSAGTDRGGLTEDGQEWNPLLPRAQGKLCTNTDSFKGLADQGVRNRCPKMNKTIEEVQTYFCLVSKTMSLPSPDHAWNTSCSACHETGPTLGFNESGTTSHSRARSMKLPTLQLTSTLFVLYMA